MKSATAGRSAGSLPKAVFTVLAWAAIAAGPAQAGCSHYVRTGSLPSSVEGSLAVLGDTGAPTNAIERFSPLAEQPGGCSGACCSGQPPPASSATLIDLYPVGNWAILWAPAQATVPEAASSPRDEQVVLPTARGTSIAHPPRFSWPLLAL